MCVCARASVILCACFDVYMHIFFGCVCVCACVCACACFFVCVLGCLCPFFFFDVCVLSSVRVQCRMVGVPAGACVFL